MYGKSTTKSGRENLKTVYFLLFWKFTNFGKVVVIFCFRKKDRPLGFRTSWRKIGDLKFVKKMLTESTFYLYSTPVTQRGPEFYVKNKKLAGEISQNAPLKTA